jgi:drug/metabolite transporter (DMT)-like permease
MSIVYPIARTIPIPLALFIELVFDRDRVFSSGYTIGVIILCLGSLLLANLKKSSKLKNSIFFACISAIAICGYSLLDHSVLRSLELLSVSENITVCIVYMFILEVGISFGLAIPLLINKAFRVDVINELINNKTPCMQMGVGMISSYILVLIAMTYAQQASLIIAFRQISIPIGFLLGVFLLKESNHKIKWVGIITISSGLIFLGLIQ